MSTTRIPSRNLDTSINVYGKSQSKNSVGEVEETLSIKYQSVSAHIQPQTSEIMYSLGGVQHRQTHACYFNRFDGGIEREIEPLDLIADLGSGNRFILLEIEERAMFSESEGTHIKLVLQRTDDTRYATFFRQELTSMARIE